MGVEIGPLLSNLKSAVHANTLNVTHFSIYEYLSNFCIKIEEYEIESGLVSTSKVLSYYKLIYFFVCYYSTELLFK